MKTQESNLVKSSGEILKLRRAAGLSSTLHTMAMGLGITGQSEKELALTLEFLRNKSGVKEWAYETIVGAGERSNILHAKPTQRIMNDKELVLIDMGVKLDGYCSDITRTWPVGEKFTKEQKEIYRIVLKAQKEVIKNVRPGKTLGELHELCRESLLDGLVRKGIAKKGDLERLFPHKTSHWIGELVHDQCPYFYQDGSEIRLSPGMCFTVEPGLYFKGFKSKYRDIGIRIEDVVLVTENGCEVLTNVPKEVAEIEGVRGLIHGRT
jgi:Xaa-Pro aminopeptidase